MPRLLPLAALVLAPCASSVHAQAAAPRTLTLEQALAAAHESNASLRAVRERVEEGERRTRVVFSNYLPRLATQAAYLASDNTRGILMPAGSLGTLPGIGRFPPEATSIPQGGSDIVFALTSLQQPVTQYFKVREGLGVTRADLAISRAELRRAEQDVALGVLKAYAGVLVAARRREVAHQRIRSAGLRSATQLAAVQSGMAPSIATTEARLRALQARQELLAAENEHAEISYALADAVGLPAGTPLAVEPPPPVADRLDSLGDVVAAALRQHPDVQEADALVAKATHGVGAARANWIPDVGLFGAHLYQSSLPFLPKGTFMFGAVGSVTLLDFGARRNTLGERRAQLNAASRNRERVAGAVRGDVEAAWRRLQRAHEMLEVAREARALRAEALRLRVAQAGAGLALAADEGDATGDALEADLDVLRAEMGYRIARAELERAAGRLAR